MSELAVLFLKGLGIGLAVAAPVGSVGVLCIRRAITVGRLSAITSGMGAAVADAFYGAVAAFGLTAVSSLMISYQKPATLFGGLFLLWLAYRIASATGKPVNPGQTSSASSLWSGFFSTFLLTITNPATILSFIAIFAGIGYVNNSNDDGAAALLVAGVFLGSAVWWVILAFLAAELQKRFGARFAVMVNIASATIIGLFGAAALASLLFQ